MFAQVVNARAANGNPVVRHAGLLLSGSRPAVIPDYVTTAAARSSIGGSRRAKYRTSPSASHQTNRDPGLRRGRPDHDEHAGRRAERRDDPDERHAERPRPVGLAHAQHEHARCRRSRTRRASRCSSDRRSRPRRRSPRPTATTSPVTSVARVRHPRTSDRRAPPTRGSRPSRAIAKKIRGCPYWNTSSTAAIDTTAPSATTQPDARVARRASAPRPADRPRRAPATAPARSSTAPTTT